MEKKELIESYFGKVRTLKEGMMEYLIELLNEYQEQKGSEIRFKRIDNSDFFVCGDDVGLGYETILSKKFGFIQWLVDNDKINTDYGPGYGFRRLSYREKGEKQYFSYEDSLLMLLSIQDNPIEFLISILK